MRYDVQGRCFFFLSPESGELVDVACGADGCETQGPENEACFPIDATADSDFTDQECLMFVRSAPVCPEDCYLGIHGPHLVFCTL